MAKHHTQIQPMKLVTVVVLTFSLLLTSSVDAAPAQLDSRVSRSSRSADAELCDMLCSKAPDFCPFSCPESRLLSPLKKRLGQSDPVDHGLGDLSFEDQMFLKMLGRLQHAA